MDWLIDRSIDRSSLSLLTWNLNRGIIHVWSSKLRPTRWVAAANGLAKSHRISTTGSARGAIAHMYHLSANGWFTNVWTPNGRWNTDSKLVGWLRYTQSTRSGFPVSVTPESGPGAKEYRFEGLHAKLSEQQESVLRPVASYMVHLEKKICLVSISIKKTLSPPIRGIWTEIVHNLKGQFQGMPGNPNARENQRRIVFSTWDSSPFYKQRLTRPNTTFQPPIWLLKGVVRLAHYICFTQYVYLMVWSIISTM
jgi:hypothetical protein